HFPLEADIAPGFELLETSTDERKIAWDALCTDASNNPNGEIAQAMETLLESSGGLANTITALNSFLDHRSDWWAYTEKEMERQTNGDSNPVQFATDTLSSQLNVSLNDKPEQEFFTPSILDLLTEFVALLQKHPGKKNEQYLEVLTVARDSNYLPPDRFPALKKAFLTQKGEPLKRKESKAQAKSMGDTGQLRFLEIHDLVCSNIEETQNIIHAQETLRRNIAWYSTGNRLLDHFQRLKNEQRLLDFSDLEWLAYLLLNKGDNVHWIQYKLDQRIDHLLIDEFQDTNPTQWRLILPLLQELAASEDERGRSVFLVGDNKQSIYRFRRADPELFNTAQSWLKTNLHAVSQPLDVSWRSADAIMGFVNRIFSEEPLHQRLSQFSTHTTHHPDLWGRVELLPLIDQDTEQEDDIENKIVTDENTSSFLRNPLYQPRIIEQDKRYLEEGRLIADRIQSMIEKGTRIGDAKSAHPIQYGDIIILIRNRTHAADYEQALRKASIPYIGADRGTLLSSQEARDLVNLLELLIAPFNNLALVNLLRSPIFNCDQDDLIKLARHKDGNWMQRLSTLTSRKSDSETKSSALNRAHTLLTQWQELAGKIPVHDLLDHIYCEGDVMNRYHAAYPPHLQHRVAANLTRFIELALEIDSGRYPTIGRFVSRLKLLRQQEQDAPDEGTPLQSDSRVRIMTIHASKGLESPV
ncbi:MAG: UvrD-helicase domain-containing protein, partial [Gammaproteobacteria bacterium]